MLKEPGRAAQSKSFLWAQMNGSGPPARLFTHSLTRNTQQAATLCAGAWPKAALMIDGYVPYEAVAERYDLVHRACWAHADDISSKLKARYPRPSAQATSPRC